MSSTASLTVVVLDTVKTDLLIMAMGVSSFLRRHKPDQFESAGRIGSILLYEFESVVESYDNRGIRPLAWG
jgi:hypothetical protein